MRIKVVYDGPPEFEALAVAEFTCPHCGKPMQMPATHMIENINNARIEALEKRMKEMYFEIQALRQAARIS